MIKSNESYKDSLLGDSVIVNKSVLSNGINFIIIKTEDVFFGDGQFGH